MSMHSSSTRSMRSHSDSSAGPASPGRYNPHQPLQQQYQQQYYQQHHHQHQQQQPYNVNAGASRQYYHQQPQQSYNPYRQQQHSKYPGNRTVRPLVNNGSVDMNRGYGPVSPMHNPKVSTQTIQKVPTLLRPLPGVQMSRALDDADAGRNEYSSFLPSLARYVCVRVAVAVPSMHVPVSGRPARAHLGLGNVWTWALARVMPSVFSGLV